ncbi:MAG: cyclic nucleotide-binding domain-containing protein [Candidatus Wallbacteria bacterium]|nr:cyclic nucleotide-binding domain-containing protein [Candidatus Wallbacteria bacterium]
MVVELLKNLPIFQDLSDAEFDKLGKVAQEEKYKPGDVLFREGDRPDAFYVVKTGEVRIVKKKDGAEQILATLVAGDFFGEMGVIEDSPRYASAIVEKPSVLVKVKRADFDSMMALNPTLALKIMATVARRYRANVSLEQVYQGSKQPVEEKKARVYVVTSMTGGAGVTTVVSNLAYELAQKGGSKVLVIDGSVQFGDLSLFLDVIPRLTLYHLTEETELTYELLEQGYINKTKFGIDLMSAPLRPEQSDVVTGDLFRKTIALLLPHYDFILMDTYSLMQEPVLTILELASEIFYLITPDLPSLKNCRLWFEVVQALEFTDAKVHVLLNKFEEDEPTLDKELIEKNLSRDIFGVIPYGYGSVTDCINKGVLITQDSPDDPVSQGFARLARLTLTPDDSGATPETEQQGWLGKLKKRFGVA